MLGLLFCAGLRGSHGARCVPSVDEGSVAWEKIYLFLSFQDSELMGYWVLIDTFLLIVKSLLRRSRALPSIRRWKMEPKNLICKAFSPKTEKLKKYCNLARE